MARRRRKRFGSSGRDHYNRAMQELRMAERAAYGAQDSDCTNALDYYLQAIEHLGQAIAHKESVGNTYNAGDTSNISAFQNKLQSRLLDPAGAHIFGKCLLKRSKGASGKLPTLSGKRR